MNVDTTSQNFIARLRTWAGHRFTALNKDQGGAVAILCLAACMILIMVALVLYDTGKMARMKIDTQNAADTAAYSQAAVKARTMNMIMYTNVAKRTIVSLYNVYVGMYTAWIIWTATRCASCNFYNPKACYDCLVNGLLAVAEASDTYKVFFGSAKKRYKEELEALDKYQNYMTELTPWWAWSEGLIRGSRNGASLTSSFPPPPGLLLTTVPDWIESATSFLGMGSLYNQTDKVDKMPLEKGTMWNTCLPLTGPSVLEFLANVAIHRQRSKLGAKKNVVILGGMALAPTEGCLISKLEFGDAMLPRKLTAKGDSADDLLAKSNIVFSYKMAPEMRGKLRKNFDILPGSYYAMTPLQYGSGVWNLSRGEFFFKGKKPTMWDPKWTAKLRPVGLPGEFDELGDDLNAMYHDLAPYIGLATLVSLGQSSISGNGGGFLDGIGAAVGDAVFMEKATRSLDNGVSGGLNK